jgi:hypothetical protein
VLERRKKMGLIDADALIHDITKLYCEDCEKRKRIKNGKLKFVYEIGDAPCRACGLDGLKDVIEETPIVDAERHGHWIGIDDEPCESYECDKCGYITEDIGCNYWIPNNFNYCPNCGAKMDIKGEEE